MYEILQFCREKPQIISENSAKSFRRKKAPWQESPERAINRGSEDFRRGILISEKSRRKFGILGMNTLTENVFAKIGTG